MKKYLTFPNLSIWRKIKYKLFEHPFIPLINRYNIRRLSSQIFQNY